MLFDLQGKRRRLVQVTYLTLALLMGGGLVFFGIGGDVSGGLFDAFSDQRSGGGNGNQIIEERIERNEKRVQANPRDERALKELTRDYYSTAASLEVDEQTGRVPEEGQDELRKAAESWRAYLALEPEKPDPSLAITALQLFGPTGLDQPEEAKEVARIRARAANDVESYLALVQYAALARDTRLANLAGQKAVDLAPKARRKAVRAQVQAAKNPQPAGGAGAAAAPDGHEHEHAQP